MDLPTKVFGTDGVRGRANVYPMTVEMAMAIGQGVAKTVKNGKALNQIVIGKDTRLSGYMFENALVAGILSAGVDVLLVGPLPTPGIAFITRSMRANAGIVISASHNPYYDNGIKVFGHDGFKLPDEQESLVGKFALQAVCQNHCESHNASAKLGKAKRIEDASGRYISLLKNAFPEEHTLDGVRLAVDCANGATYKIAPAVFSELGAQLKLLGVNPDGTNINQGVGSLYPEKLQEMVRAGEADLGLAFDGDGDRLIMVDEKGELIDGDQIMAISAEYMSNRGALAKQTVVGTVMSNLGLEMCLRERGIKLLRTKVGDRYVVEAMRQTGACLGGEQSGHLLFLDKNTTGDGILSAIMVLKVMIETGKPLSELKKIMPSIPQILLNLPVKERKAISQVPALQKAIAQQEEILGDTGRILVRYSGTELLLRIMVEAQDDDKMKKAAEALKQVAQDALGREK
ncbi:phosphoglucosamine mutase [Dethiosulfatarculus sandiegensis]|uniref:Phosphoglucosamine mutase n=1 Tax=Dethiosulfatarculus sandiegensis TaxID=1429043 RepID=A0A0D2J1G0_9BACT|nr:phosphoglucosamine mutase [Dethiosulfatarculus sandiegensis]KIX12024.1 phosphoglucosamine mutase [Dethiosulfatarculus sandiegensis]